ncbi:hypothetical protein [Endozoicomonas sp. ONNA1]|uniref:hypothetical protein n=1 Tax=Endozoicomonas sp. ONNA1 TaxID=2828740 RepID=UPI0021487767|nr:hypothetical protein [Endozoicomonas sp. ONNA1]
MNFTSHTGPGLPFDPRHVDRSQYIVINQPESIPVTCTPQNISQGAYEHLPMINAYTRINLQVNAENNAARTFTFNQQSTHGFNNREYASTLYWVAYVTEQMMQQMPMQQAVQQAAQLVVDIVTALNAVDIPDLWQLLPSDAQNAIGNLLNQQNSLASSISGKPLQMPNVGTRDTMNRYAQSRSWQTNTQTHPLQRPGFRGGNPQQSFHNPKSFTGGYVPRNDPRIDPVSSGTSPRQPTNYRASGEAGAWASESTDKPANKTVEVKEKTDHHSVSDKQGEIANRLFPEGLPPQTLVLTFMGEQVYAYHYSVIDVSGVEENMRETPLLWDASQRVLYYIFTSIETFERITLPLKSLEDVMDYKDHKLTAEVPTQALASRWDIIEPKEDDDTIVDRSGKDVPAGNNVILRDFNYTGCLKDAVQLAKYYHLLLGKERNEHDILSFSYLNLDIVYHDKQLKSPDKALSPLGSPSDVADLTSLAKALKESTLPENIKATILRRGNDKINDLLELGFGISWTTSDFVEDIEDLEIEIEDSYGEKVLNHFQKQYSAITRSILKVLTTKGLNEFIKYSPYNFELDDLSEEEMKNLSEEELNRAKLASETIKMMVPFQDKIHVVVLPIDFSEMALGQEAEVSTLTEDELPQLHHLVTETFATIKETDSNLVYVVTRDNVPLRVYRSIFNGGNFMIKPESF